MIKASLETITFLEKISSLNRRMSLGAQFELTIDGRFVRLEVAR